MAYSKYDVIMKVLEIIEQDGRVASGSVTDERVSQITTIIARVEGDLIHEQTMRKETVVEGDKFENISQSVIATRGSIAKGVIKVREEHGDDVADALQVLESALGNDQHLSAEDKKEALELLQAITQQGGKAEASKPVLRSLGSGLWKVIEKVEPLSKACLAAWKVIEKIWT
jgi:hypothetical protein